MRPLQFVAMGLLIVALRAPFGGYDALADPVGWGLVLVGLRRLPGDLWQRGLLTGLAVAAALVSLPLWVPDVVAGLEHTHDSLLWAVNLPQLGFTAVLARGLGLRARVADVGSSARWLQLAWLGFVVAAVLPVLVFGAGVGSLEVASYVGGAAVLLVFIWLLFAYSARPWAGFRDSAAGAGEAT